MKEIKLPHILDQKNVPACICFSVATLADYYLQQKRIDDQIDAFKLFDETERGGNGANAMKVLNWGKETGLPSMGSKRYKIREFQGVAQSLGELERNLDQHGGLVFTYDLHDRDNFAGRLNSDFVLSRAPMDIHAMVLCGYDKVTKKFKVANSWGERFGQRGYFYIPYPLMRTEFLRQVFWFSIS